MTKSSLTLFPAESNFLLELVYAGDSISLDSLSIVGLIPPRWRCRHFCGNSLYFFLAKIHSMFITEQFNRTVTKAG